MFGLLAVERAKREAAEKNLAVAHAHIEWLTTYISVITAERSALFERVLGVSLPPVGLGYQRPETSSAIAAPPLTAEALRAQYAREGNPVPPLANAPRTIDDAMKELNFEDLGDEDAARMGVHTDKDGEIAYSR